jgi:hypothetical protein
MEATWEAMVASAINGEMSDRLIDPLPFPMVSPKSHAILSFSI